LRVLGIGVAVAVGSLLAMLAMSWVRSQAAIAVVQTHVEDIRGGKVEEAYALFSTGYRSGVTLPMFRRFLRREDRLVNVQEVDFWGRSVWGETALLWGSFRDNLGHRFPVRYLLVRENGSWKIENFHLSAAALDSAPASVRMLHI
jgi:hypothetical protein